MDSSIKPPNYTRYAGDFLSACNGPSSPNHLPPPPQYTPSEHVPQSQDTAKQAQYYSTRPKPAQESANSTRQDEYHHYRTSPNFYHNRVPPCPAPAVDRNASVGTQNEYRCYQSNPDFYHNRRDDLNGASTVAQGMQAATTTENKLGQVAQQRDFYYARSQEGPPQGSDRWDYADTYMQQTQVTAMRDAYYNGPLRESDQWGRARRFEQQRITTAMRDAYYHRRPDQGDLRK